MSVLDEFVFDYLRLPYNPGRRLTSFPVYLGSATLPSKWYARKDIIYVNASKVKMYNLRHNVYIPCKYQGYLVKINQQNG